MPLEQLAYEDAKRAIDRQSDQLDGLRDRAGTLLAAIALATSFFGGLALSDDDLSSAAITAAVVAIVAFSAAAGGCVAVLWPRAQWAFNLSAKKIIYQLETTSPNDAKAYRELALRTEANYHVNEGRLDDLFSLFRGACIALALETIAWIVVLAL